MSVLSAAQLARYPFCSGAKKILEGEGISITDAGILERARARILGALDGKLPEPAGEPAREIAAYAAARVLLSLLNRKALISRYAVAEAKRVGEALRQEDDAVVALVAGELGVRFEKDSKKYRMRVFDYLRHAPRSADYKLSNRSVEGGWVKLSRAECIRVVSEALQKSIERSLPARVDNAPEEAQRAARELELLLPKEAPAVMKVAAGAYPPCMQRLLEELAESANLPHNARFALAAYLLNIGMDMEKVVALFRTAPDFDEKITRYQVAFIAKKGYRVPACAALDMQGICVADCRVGTPLRYRPGAEKPWGKGS
ncbi:MAG: hypothetical protein QXG98_03265 [Candidatus Micrarchaeia archaeon]